MEEAVREETREAVQKAVQESVREEARGGVQESVLVAPGTRPRHFVRRAGPVPVLVAGGTGAPPRPARRPTGSPTGTPSSPTTAAACPAAQQTNRSGRQWPCTPTTCPGCCPPPRRSPPSSSPAASERWWHWSSPPTTPAWPGQARPPQWSHTNPRPSNSCRSTNGPRPYTTSSKPRRHSQQTASTPHCTGSHGSPGSTRPTAHRTPHRGREAPNRCATPSSCSATTSTSPHRHRLDLAALQGSDARIVPAAGENSAHIWPHRCAQLLAAEPGTACEALPGGHNGYAFRPRATAKRLHRILTTPGQRAAGGVHRRTGSGQRTADGWTDGRRQPSNPPSAGAQSRRVSRIRPPSYTPPSMATTRPPA